MRRAATKAAGTIASAMLTTTTATVGALTAYLAVITGAARRKPTSRRRPARSTSLRFAIFVPAHNEEAVIGEALESFRRLDYPAEQFVVHVVADNCTDGTADVVTRFGFSVHERTDLAAPGKGPALNWLFDRLQDGGEQFDAVVIVDADTRLRADFLQHVCRALDDGARAAQGLYMVHDAAASPATALRAAAMACRHNLRPLGRTALGASCGLYGNGMVFDTELMKGRRWSGHLTEDAEFQMDLLLDGELVVYVPDAVLEAEMPRTLEASATQNQRWELGRLQMARRYVPILAKRIASGPPQLRVAYADAIVDHLVPPLSVLVATNASCMLGAAAMTGARGRRTDRLNLVVSVLSGAAIVAHVLAGLRSVNAPRSTYRALLSAPRLIAWKLALWIRVLARPNDVTWTRTARNVEART